MNSKWNIGKIGLCISMLVALAAVVGCDWTSKSDGFNTSSGSGDINFSGTYHGNIGGSRAVEQTSGGPVARLVVSQQGDALEVLDNNGSVYRGRIGSVAVVSTPGGDAFPAGTRLAQAQVSWRGHDNVAAKSVQFVGNISAVAVTDIKGVSENESQTTEGRIVDSRTSVEEDGDYTITTTRLTIDRGGYFEETETVVVVDNRTKREVSRTETVTGRRTVERVMQYLLSPQNTQYHLQGTWVEQDGVAAGVSALSAGAAGAIVVGAP